MLWVANSRRKDGSSQGYEDDDGEGYEDDGYEDDGYVDYECEEHECAEHDCGDDDCGAYAGAAEERAEVAVVELGYLVL